MTSALRSVVHPRLFDSLTRTNYVTTCTIETPTYTQDEYGEADVSWAVLSEHCDLACQVAPAGGAERRNRVQTIAESTHNIALTSYRPLILTSYRVVDADSNRYDILAVEHDSQQAHTLLRCRIVSV